MAWVDNDDVEAGEARATAELIVDAANGREATGGGETIDWQEYDEKNHVIAWLLVEALSIDDLIEDIAERAEWDPKALSVRLEVNGFEVPFVKVMQMLEDQLEEVEKKGYDRGVESGTEATLEKMRRFVLGDDYE